MQSSSSKGKRIPKGKRLRGVPAKPLKPLKPKKAPHGKEKEVDEGMFISLLCCKSHSHILCSGVTDPNARYHAHVVLSHGQRLDIR